MALNLPQQELAEGSLTGRITSAFPWSRFTAQYPHSQYLIVRVALRCNPREFLWLPVFNNSGCGKCSEVPHRRYLGSSQRPLRLPSRT